MDRSALVILIAENIEPQPRSPGNLEMAERIADAITEQCIILNRTPYDLFGNGIATTVPIYVELSTDKTFQEIIIENDQN